MPTSTYWNTHTAEQVIAFTKTHPSFVEAEYPEHLIDTMNCDTYEEWCDYICEINQIYRCKMVSKYFDFDRMLLDEFNNSEAGGGQAYFLVGRNEKGDLYFLDDKQIKSNDLSWCWIVTMNTH